MTVELCVVIPTRGRPENMRRAIEAWRETGAFECAEMLLAIDEDDPHYREYVDLVEQVDHLQVDFHTFRTWFPMVRKLNATARYAADIYPYVGFAGDDHVPRTEGWAQRYRDSLWDLGTGIVYGNDLHRGIHLPTQWAMTSDIIQTLDRMVPALVRHLFCDRSVLDLGRAANCIRYLPDVVVEHMHYQAGKTDKDELYASVNNKQNQEKERRRYLRWHQELLPWQTELVKELIRVESVGGDSGAP